ncbi:MULTISPECIES: branched-chain amino acid ABC transporter permease [Acidithrix]|uniref:High-affinity branched-chain amino acid transport system permease protein LivH n=1 Tax=Acidithrix ferrooxidans TaxID=1280514 RepID=A0A0D8HGA2_9ACTN|nr:MULTISPECIES: branched-chain amino acid ABC transporter permease [Acidithrix]KJF16869.1 high-affinity branched-chain amino acid transport system permease protein LivH [Acidithrix ferrooxidans]
MKLFLLTLGFGFVSASIYALLSVGLSLQFGVTNFVNFAYGAYLGVGMLLTYTFSATLGLPFWLSIVLATIGTGIVSMLISEFILSPFVKRRKSLFYMLIVTFGLSLILDNVLQIIYGVGFNEYPIGQSSPVTIGPFSFTGNQLIIIAIAGIVMIGVHLLLSRSRLGKAMRAMSDNADLARASGIDTNMVTRWTWFISGALAGLGGIVLALNIVSFQTTSGDALLFVIFAAVILGGIGQTYGAMLGALIIGVVTEVSTVFISSAYKQDIAFLVLVIMLLVRPQGLIPAKGKA